MMSNDRAVKTKGLMNNCYFTIRFGPFSGLLAILGVKESQSDVSEQII